MTEPAPEPTSDPTADPAVADTRVTVLVAGAGVTGRAVVHALRGLADVVLTGDHDAPPWLDEAPGVRWEQGLTAVPDGVSIVVASPGLRPSTPVLLNAAARGIEVIGEVELAWRLDRSGRLGDPRPWLAVTGTNGKTTTTGMLESILRAAGRTVTACGNIGWPAVEAVAATDPAQQVIAAELSSFQLHSAPTLRPTAGVVLNVAEDHLDWHGSMQAYGQAKARVLTGDWAVAVLDDPGAAALLRDAPAARWIGVTAAAPEPGQIGVVDGTVVDRAVGGAAGRELFAVADVRPPGPHNVTNAMAAAALALTVGATPDEVARGLRAFVPGGHRNVLVCRRAGVDWVDDSKATNPHAAAASLLSYPRVVWIAGGQLKGASVDDLVIAVRDRLAGVVLLGVDAPVLAAALSRHAPDVPVRAVPGTDDGVMTTVVRQAAALAGSDDTVVLAPAAASLDMFSSYADRGNAFSAAAQALPDGPVAAPVFLDPEQPGDADRSDAQQSDAQQAGAQQTGSQRSGSARATDQGGRRGKRR
ncbi:UDP-N-acetylmuramoyl-L-alanine--D-glutamate ligase [Nakamurella flavida]|uniref:UDP-N-acetylmuramoylalanine--D-glutamate ligase n=1 Tax=Nakamurella flavida TaxID=363630 RepID=A0A938YKA8_9ACTN|nr:UDP-N-acetylmuramoyl-L-alanine--D-glutamate ligase [Nakamurella flavida]MBM9477532.1 UDP-N-acetylmuramoyl-L-alanine--D-glutamate ligase [Nakamurella flavida]MDP9777465.1 UDP-N-acetylmuramoylalanine--D-glutamate ligase [Nakamurella flavida]